MEETIVAPATPAGRGGISVVRLSGGSASLVGTKLCGGLPEPWTLKACSFSGCGGEVIDSGLVVFFASPRSYTGEDVVELHCHGNPLIVDAIVSSAVGFGARLAEPGEFTKRAFLNNKVDLAQAESVSDLISARTGAALRGASSSLSGDFSKMINTSIDRLVDLRVLVEAGLDFPEEEGVGGGLEDNDQVLFGLKKEAAFIGGLLFDSRASQILREGARVVIVGPPNCGKSTLLNFFAKEDMAITSESPGTTRDMIRTTIDLGGVPVELVDTAGIRLSEAGLVEKEGMRRALEEAKKADLVLVVSVVGEGCDIGLGEEVPVIRVFNKSDLFSPEELRTDGEELFVSALHGSGLDVLVERMCSVVGAGLNAEVPLLARRRHLSFLESSRECLERAVAVVESLGGMEVVAEELRGAQFALGQITRPVSSDDLLGEIFSSFCIGK